MDETGSLQCHRCCENYQTRLTTSGSTEHWEGRGTAWVWQGHHSSSSDWIMLSGEILLSLCNGQTCAKWTSKSLWYGKTKTIRWWALLMSLPWTQKTKNTRAKRAAHPSSNLSALSNLICRIWRNEAALINANEACWYRDWRNSLSFQQRLNWWT